MTRRDGLAEQQRRAREYRQGMREHGQYWSSQDREWAGHGYGVDDDESEVRGAPAAHPQWAYDEDADDDDWGSPALRHAWRHEASTWLDDEDRDAWASSLNQPIVHTAPAGRVHPRWPGTAPGRYARGPTELGALRDPAPGAVADAPTSWWTSDPVYPEPPRGFRRARPSQRGRGPKGYVRSDERIREDVCDALLEHDGVDASNVEVQVRDGEVTLTGTVPDRSMKRAAENAAERCRGVKFVANRLRRNPAPETAAVEPPPKPGAAARANGPGATASQVGASR